MHGEGGGSALTSSVPDLGLQSSLKRTTAKQSEALLQEAEALAEVTAQEKGDGHRPGRAVRHHPLSPPHNPLTQGDAADYALHAPLPSCLD